MKRIIGYKWEIIYDNGCSCEDWREVHYESPIYLTREAAMKAVLLTKENSLKQYEEQKERRIKENNYPIASINSMYINNCKWLDTLEEKVKITPIYAYDEATAEFKFFNIGD